MAETLNRIPSCRCCYKNGVFKSLFSDFIYENEIENYSQMLYDTFGISLESSECDKIYTICDECIEKLRISSEFKIGILACEKKIKREPTMIENDVTFKIEKMWSYACSNNEGPLIADDIKVKREETISDEDSDAVIKTIPNSARRKVPAKKIVKKVKNCMSADAYKALYFKKKCQNAELERNKIMMEIVNRRKENYLKMG